MILIRHRIILGALISVLTLGTSSPDAGAQPAARDPATGLTMQTRRQGGERPREQMALDFRHLDLSMKIDPARRRIEGDATLTLRASEPVQTLIIDLSPDYDIASISLDGATLARSAYENPEGQLRIRLPQPLQAGEEVAARIVYAGAPHVARRPPWEGGVVWSTTPDGQPWVGSTMWGGGCDMLWPCIDHPTRKPALADLHYIVPAPLVAPANGEFLGMTEENGWRTYNWRARSPHTYGVVINVGPFELLEADYHSRFGNTIPMRYWHIPGREAQAQHLFEEFPRILDFFEARIGPYPWADQKMGVVETSFSGMEHQTINGYGSNYAKSQYGYDILLQHEFAHEYFGNQVSNANYDDLWIHEGFGAYMQPLYAEALNGDRDYFAYLLSQRMTVANEQALVSRTERTEEDVYLSGAGPRGDIYVKGSLVLHTLRALIGDDDFFESLRRLVYGRADPRPGNFEPQLATTADFNAIVNDVAGRDLDWFFDVYLYRATLPELVEERTDRELRLRWRTPDDLPFPMPVDVRVNDRIATLQMRNGAGSVRAPRDARITIDPHGKVLRQSEAIDAFQAWRRTQAERQGQ